MDRTFPLRANVMLCLLAMTAGTTVFFEHSPDEVKAGLSRNMSLRCSIKDSVPDGAVIGRDLETVANNLQRISSIIVMQNGTDIASVTQGSPAKSLIGSTDVQITGSVSGDDKERGYIELTWQYPTHVQGGAFVCEANGMTDAGHIVVLSKTVNVELATPSTVDLTNHVRELELERDRLQLQFDAGQASTQQLINNLQQQFTAEKEQTSKRLANLEHTESGLIDCGNSAGWNGRHTAYGHTTRSIDKTASFSHSYDKEPVVFVAVETMYADTWDEYLSYLAQVVDVKTDKFTLRCSTWSGHELINFRIRWISLPQ